MVVLVTGAAGFIGFHVARRLLARGDRVIALDNLDPYYSVRLKRARLEQLVAAGCVAIEGDISDDAAVARAFAERPDAVVHLAAQVGVRHSIDNPGKYIAANVVGFGKVIEAARAAGVRHFVYASSSSVYGANRALPFAETHLTDHPISVYAATKKSNELIAHSYSHLFALPTSGLRFFTVYGPWGRPDMALFRFARMILAGEPIPLYGEGARRDFTYVDDAAAAVVAVLDRPARGDETWEPEMPHAGASAAPYRVLNVGSRTSVEVTRVIALLEEAIGRTAVIERMPAQSGDLLATAADVGALAEVIGPRVATPLEVGVARFVAWYRESYAGVLDAE